MMKQRRRLSILVAAAMVVQLFAGITFAVPTSFAASSSIPAAGLPSYWLTAAISEVGYDLGDTSVSFANKQFKLSSQNGKMASTGDNIAYAYLPVDIPITGVTDFTLTARISNYTLTTNSNSWAVLMVKDGVKYHSPMVALGLDFKDEKTRVRDYRRLGSDIGGGFDDVDGVSPVYVKLIREGETLRFLYSTDGVDYRSRTNYSDSEKNKHYTLLGQKPLNIGFAVASGSATFDQVKFVVGGTTVFDSETITDDTSPPEAPNGLTAIAMDRAAQLTWNTVTNATYYNVKQSLQDGGPYTTTQRIEGGLTQALESGLTNDTPYYYVVSAANSYGESTDSAQIAVTPTGLTVPGLYELSGFATYTTGGGLLDKSDPAYHQVYNATDLGNALRKDSGAKVIEIMNDLDLGWLEIEQDARKAPFSKHNDPLLHPTLLKTGVSKITIDGADGLTIFSNNGSKIRHASLTFKNSSNIIIRNLEFDELWEWDEATKGDYDRNDWDYISLEDNTSKVWIDHCTFNKAYDGVVDAKGGSNGITISWSLFRGDDQSSNSWVSQQFDALEKLPAKYPMYNFLKGLGFSKEDIIAVQAGQKKGHLIGASEFTSDNPQLELTLHHNYYDDMMDRIPRLRGGNAHVYNIVVDNADTHQASKLISPSQAAAIAVAEYHFGVISNGAISTEGGALLIENSIITDVLYPLRNNQKSDIDPRFTGKIKATNVHYSLDGENLDGINFTGDSDTPDSPLAPAPGEALPFSWNLTDGKLPYLYAADDLTSLSSSLTSEGGAGAGQLFWNKDNWLRTSSYTGPIDTEPNEAPARVGGLHAEAGDGQVTLRWGKVGTATSYTVYSIDPDSLAYTPLQTGITESVFTVTGLTNGTSYIFAVRAVNSFGESGDGRTLVVKPFVLESPGSPLLTVSSASTKILLDWEEPPYTDYYIVKRSTVSGGPYMAIADPVFDTRYEDTTALEDTMYYYIVVPVNSVGEGDSSSEGAAKLVELHDTDNFDLLFEDTFDAAITGTKPDHYTIDETSGSGTIQIADIPSSTDKSLQIFDDRTGVVQADRVFESQTAVTAIEFDFMQESKANSIKVLRLATSGGEGKTSNGVAAVAIETNGGNLSYRTNAGYESFLSNYSAGTWYTIKIVSDIGKQKADIYVNGELVKEQIGFYNPVTDIAVLQSFTANSNSANTYYLDNIKVYVPKPDAEVIPPPFGTGGGSLPASNVTTTADGVQLKVSAATGTTANGEPSVKASIPKADWQNAVQSIGNGPAVIHINLTNGEAVHSELEIDAASITEALTSNKSILLKLQTNFSSYELPLSALELEPLLAELNGKLEDATLTVSLTKLTGEARSSMEQDAKEANLNLLSDGVSYAITLNVNGKSAELNNFGGQYISRTLSLAADADKSRAVGVNYNPTTGQFSFVPTWFDSSANETTATLKRSGNSIYTVVDAARSFNDLAGHWAKIEVERLASLLLINGVSDIAFAPDRSITRAEFAAMLTRGLGLSDLTSAAFEDISASAWYAGSIGAASAAGLILGYEDGNFRPNDSITREQMAVMIARSIKAATLEQQPASDTVILEAFSDRAAISEWAASSAAAAVQAGIIEGNSSGAFKPGYAATRAEAAVMLQRLLHFISFIE